MRLNILKVLILFFAIFLNADVLKENYITIENNTSKPLIMIDFESDNLEKFIMIDSNKNGIVSWKELYQKQKEIEKFVLKYVELKVDDRSCSLTPKSFKVYRRVHQSYIKLLCESSCQRAEYTISLRYNLFFDVDKDQKAFVSLKGSKQKPIMISSHQPLASFKLKEKKSAWESFKNFFVEGVWHIWMGYDHILFLLMLILSTVYFQSGFRAIMIDILKVVTAFSVAHSITLALSALKIVSINPQFIEVAIALSVLFTAVNNLYPMVEGRLYLLAFGFGLIHGFGFANVLRELLVDAKEFASMLVGFNLGVESGQLMIVLCVVPVFYLFRKKRLFLYLLSSVTAMIALYWAVDRAFSL